MKETTIDQTLVLCDLDTCCWMPQAICPSSSVTCCSFLPAGAAG